MNRQTLRQTIRQQRLSLDPEQRIAMAKQLTEHVLNSDIFLQSQTLAAYMAHGGEMDPKEIIAQALLTDKQIYLPVLSKGSKEMQFAEYHTSMPLHPNQFGIHEPKAHEHYPPQQLDLVLTPLIAFDAKGNRIGQGGGYYDHTFHFLRENASLKPFLLGIAYNFQQQASIASEDWDIPLDAIATESGILFTG